MGLSDGVCSHRAALTILRTGRTPKVCGRLTKRLLLVNERSTKHCRSTERQLLVTVGIRRAFELALMIGIPKAYRKYWRNVRCEKGDRL